MKKILLIIITLIACKIFAQSWQPLENQFPELSYIWKPYIDSGGNVWSTGLGRTEDHEYNYINYLNRSVDNGQTWEKISFPSDSLGFLVNVFPVDKDTFWLAFNSYESEPTTPIIYKTEDGGSTWLTYDPAISSFINGIHFFNKMDGVAYGDYDEAGMEVSTTNDGGVTWTKVEQANLPVANEEEGSYFDSFNAYGDNLFFVTFYNRLIITKDKGLTWSEMVFPLGNESLWWAEWDTKGNLYAIYYTGEPQTLLFKSSDLGETWEELPLADNEWYLQDMAAVPGSNTLLGIFHKGYEDIEEVHTRISMDEGLSWLTIDTSSTVSFATFINENIGYASGRQHFTDTHLFKYTGSPITGLLNRKSLNLEIELFPNPGSDYINIQVGNLPQSPIVILINDYQGKLLYKKEVQVPSMLDQNIDIQSFAPGNYLITISSTEGMSSKNFTKM